MDFFNSFFRGGRETGSSPTPEEMGIMPPDHTESRFVPDLKDAPMYHLFLEVSPDGIVEPRAAQLAQQQLDAFLEDYPDAATALNGKTLEEARTIVADILHTS